MALLTLRTPGGIRSKTAACSAGDSDECNGSTRNSLRSPKRCDAVSAPIKLEMSAMPGKNTSTAPSPRFCGQRNLVA
eukprot:scaffold161374_cov27-Tisochrysis_lutea.AAC.3